MVSTATGELLNWRHCQFPTAKRISRVTEVTPRATGWWTTRSIYLSPQRCVQRSSTFLCVAKWTFCTGIICILSKSNA